MLHSDLEKLHRALARIIALLEQNNALLQELKTGRYGAS